MNKMTRWIKMWMMVWRKGKRKSSTVYVRTMSYSLFLLWLVVGLTTAVEYVRNRRSIRITKWVRPLIPYCTNRYPHHMFFFFITGSVSSEATTRAFTWIFWRIFSNPPGGNGGLTRQVGTKKMHPGFVNGTEWLAVKWKRTRSVF